MTPLRPRTSGWKPLPFRAQQGAAGLLPTAPPSAHSGNLPAAEHMSAYYCQGLHGAANNVSDLLIGPSAPCWPEMPRPTSFVSIRGA